MLQVKFSSRLNQYNKGMDTISQASGPANLYLKLLRLIKPLQSLFLPPLRLQDETRDRLAWLALLRWLAVLAQLICLSLALRLEFIAPVQAPLLYGLVAILALANLWACFSLNQGLSLLSGNVSLLGWLLFDTMQFLLLLSLNQGIHNPFYSLIYLHAALGAVLLPMSLGWAVLAVLGAGLYLMNPVVYVFNSQQTFVRMSALVGWGIQFGTLLALWAIAGWASRRMLAWRHQAEKLRSQQQSLQRVHLLGALGAGVAHEFATPLNTLRLRLERLKRQQSEPGADLQAALKALEQCELRLRNMASLPTQAELAQLAPLRLRPYLEQHLANWQRNWPQVELKLDLKLEEGFELPLPELVLSQALDNLLNNAAQAIKGVGPIEVRLWRNDRELWFEISDKGPGWPEQVLKHLGEPFVTTRQQGTGLGLYTVNLLGQALGGQLSLQENLPQGARVLLCLPLNQPL